VSRTAADPNRIVALVAEWLCFWDAETRARNEPRGVPSERIHIPHGKARVSVGDVIYCMVIVKNEMQFLRRVEVASVQDDPEDEEAVFVEEGADAELPERSIHEVPPEVVEVMQYENDAGSLLPMPVIAVLIDPSWFQGRESLRALAEGADELDALL
jgi:hypothetical protein